MHLTPQQLALMEYMSDISEDAYCAGWMSDLEYDLWQILVDGQGKYGGLTVTPEQIARLRELSSACGGWIVFDMEEGETFVPMERWLAMFEQHASGAAPGRDRPARRSTP